MTSARRVSLSAVLVGLAMSLPAWANLTPPSSGYASVTGGKDAVPCGGIAGSSGLLKAWSNTKSYNWIISIQGSNGAEWTGVNEPLCSVPMAQETVTLVHKWVRNGTTDVAILVDLTTSTMDSGTASQSNPLDGQWWWSPTVRVTDKQPTVVITKTDDSTSEPGWATPSDPYEQYDAHTVGTAVPAGNYPIPHQNAGQPITSVNATHGVASFGGEGTDPSDDTDYRNSTSDFSTLDIRDVKVTYEVKTDAAATADNCSVTNWKFQMISRLSSTVLSR